MNIKMPEVCTMVYLYVGNYVLNEELQADKQQI
jgi:hypothetical protein